MTEEQMHQEGQTRGDAGELWKYILLALGWAFIFGLLVGLVIGRLAY